VQYIFLSHDIEWHKQGPSIEHILERKDRFDKRDISDLISNKPYYCIPEYIELEEKFNVKSTFFFRTLYEKGDFRDYKNDISELLQGGWEVGLHLDPLSVYDLEKIKKEKYDLETITKTKILSNRVHYLNFVNDLPRKLKELGFVYDSSIRKTKTEITAEEMGYEKIDGIVEFPVTLMDAYLLTAMKIPENKLISVIENTLNIGRKLNGDFNIITLLWHGEVLKMKGGRMYGKILEFLTCQDDVKICRGIDIAKLLERI
jgi:peptidoglycan/xylan/chitin deacetylase (PgdA/CDA1 family)